MVMEVIGMIIAFYLAVLAFRLLEVRGYGS